MPLDHFPDLTRGLDADPGSLRGNWNYPTAVRFGAGRQSELPALCRELGMRHPLLVTDPGLADLPVTAQVVATCTAAGLPTTVCAEARPNPVGDNVTAGVAAYKAAGCDGVIAFGGGSALDVGKAVAMMVGQDRPLWDFEDVGDWWTRVNVEGMAPCVAVPTTSGTGSEVGRASVITDPDTHTKKIIFHPNMLPGRVLLDPALTVGLPAKLTAAVGMDALSHNLEAWCARGLHPQADGIAAEGMRLIALALPTAVRDGQHLTARALMAVASLMGATAFQKGLGAMHALSHPLGATLDLHHGLCNAVVMPYVLVFNRPAIEDRMTRLSAYMGLPDPSFDAFLKWVLDLRKQLGIPDTLGQLGVTVDSAAPLATMAAADPSAGGNPIALDEAALRGLYIDAIEGRI